MANQNFFGKMSGWVDAYSKGFAVRVQRIGRATFAASALGVLAACGGGGASAPTIAGGDVTVLPGVTDMFPNTPVTFSISGGQPPYTVFSSNSSILPLNLTVASGSTFVATANNPVADTGVTITVRDSTGKTATATANVKTEVLLNSVTVTPSTNAGNACGGADVCTGSEAILSVRASANGGPLAGRNVRFEVLTGALGIVSGATTVSTLILATDSRGAALVTLRAPIGAPSQFSTVRITDVTSNKTTSLVLTIGQTVDPTAIQIVPNNFQWTGAFNDGCAVGALTSHLVTGGTPPYTVRQSIPDFAIITGSPLAPASVPVPANGTTVGINGGSIIVVVTGFVCSAGASGNTLTVTDAIGRVATFTIGNLPGSAARPATGGALTLPNPALSPASFAGLSCGVSFSSFVSQTVPSGYTGTPPVLSATALEPLRLRAELSGGIVTVTRLSTGPGGGGTSLVRVSNGVNFSDISVTFDGAAPFACSGTGGSGSPVTIADGSGLSLSLAAVPNTKSVTVSGGTQPYTVTSLAPTLVSVSLDGITFASSVTIAAGAPRVYFARPIGGTGTSLLTITDSSTPAQTVVQIVTVGP